MVSQGYKEIPKTIRTNWTAVILFEIANQKEVEVIYEENTMGLKKEDWLEMYRYAVTGDYCFLYLNSKKPRRLRCMLNFDRVLFYDVERGGEYEIEDNHPGAGKEKRQKLNKK